jgi:hypothetical protein
LSLYLLVILNWSAIFTSEDCLKKELINNGKALLEGDLQIDL